MRKKLVFVHGLGGSAKSTWANFSKLIEVSEDVECDAYYYEYPTFPVRIPFFQSKYGSIQDLAKGLKTFIDHNFEDDDDVILVGHSLGGLIIRKYLLDEKIAGAYLKVRKVLFYAVPQIGSMLANISNLLSWKHRQVKQLCKESDFLDQLNDSWAAAGIDEQLIVKCVIGLADKVVGTESLKGFCRRHSIEVIPEKGHRDIIEPTSTDEMIFVIFKNFLREFFPITKASLHGALLYRQWSSMEDVSQFEFLPDNNRREYIKAIQELVAKPKQCIRVLGMSGLGKTRLTYEVFRYELETNELAIKTLYFDVANGFDDLQRHVVDWVSRGFCGILVLDNCEIEKHQQIAKQIRRKNSNLSFISLDFNPDEDPDSKTFKVERLSNSLIKDMLEPVYGKDIADLDRIVEFAQGFPQMAVMLSRARLNQDGNMGRLSDPVLVRKMLWGNESPIEHFHDILRCSALFDKFGLEGEASSEYEFIADAVAGVDEGLFYACIKKFERRGVFERRGRYVQLVPKPLAIHLASEWWDSTPIKDQKDLVLKKMPGQLQNSFCQQIKKLDFLPEVKGLTSSLCGTQSPFGQAEVILSDRGSSLFCALVEVNPYATSEALYRILQPLGHEQLESISGQVRRHLVRSLEKLCFHEEVFEKSAKCLLWLASAENESWGNSATGEFKQLFRTFLSGTEAPPKQRLSLIDFALSSDQTETKELAINAMGAAIDTHGGSRMVGAEYQGSGKPLEEWRPKIWQEAFDYWAAVLDRLVDVVVNKSEVSSLAKDVIGSNIRGLMQYGRVHELDVAINRIVEVDGPLWPEALDSIKSSLSYDSKKMPEEGLAKLHEWVQLLTPESLDDRIKLIISIPSWEHDKEEDGHYIDVAANNSEAFAKELADDISVLQPYLPQLLQGEQRKAYWFGRCLVLNAHQWEPLLSESISFLESVDNANPSFMYGLLDGVGEIEFGIWDSYISRLGDSKQLAKSYPSALTTGEINGSHLKRILDLIKCGHLEVSAVIAFTYGRALGEVSEGIVTSFISELRCISNQAAWMALDILSMYCHGDKEKWNSCAKTFEEILVNLSLVQENKSHQLDTYHWSEAANKLLEKGDASFAQQLAGRILEACDERIGYGDLTHYVKPVMRKLLETYGEDVWPIIAKAIKTEEPLIQYRMAQLFSHEDSFNKGGKSVLSDLNDTILFQWCRSEPDFAPVFVARSVEVIVDHNGSCILSRRAQFLIDEFGDSEAVLSALSSNMGSFGWTGSVVPYYKKEVAALTPLKSHQKSSVREWADRRISYLEQRIKSEAQRDEEISWGIR